MKTECLFSELELDALQEAMNIGFGQAAAALSDVISMHVVMHVPKISQIDQDAIANFIHQEVENPQAYSMVEQFFLGHFNGTSFLVLPEEDSRKLVHLFQIGPTDDFSESSMASLEREVILELGNIIIGACVGKVAEILEDQVHYTPPHYVSGPLSPELIRQHVNTDGSLALVFKTVFHFEQHDVIGFLFLVTGDDSTFWLKQAVGQMLEGLI